MECPNCKQELKTMDFSIFAGETTCPECNKRLVFHPKWILDNLFFVAFMVICDYTPRISNAYYNFIVYLIIVLVYIIVVKKIMIAMKWGKIVEKEPKDEKEVSQ